MMNHESSTVTSANVLWPAMSTMNAIWIDIQSLELTQWPFCRINDNKQGSGYLQRQFILFRRRRFMTGIALESGITFTLSDSRKYTLPSNKHQSLKEPPTKQLFSASLILHCGLIKQPVIGIAALSTPAKFLRRQPKSGRGTNHWKNLPLF